MQGPDGKHIFSMVKVGEKGQIVIPKEARELFGIQPGDTLMRVGEEATRLAVITSATLKQFFADIIGGERIPEEKP